MLQKILACKFDGGLIGLRTAGTKINAPAAAHPFRRQAQKTARKPFCGSRMKLRTVREGKLRRLLGHRVSDRSYAVPDVDYRGLTGCVQVFAAV
jgi:hypothetical protein